MPEGTHWPRELSVHEARIKAEIAEDEGRSPSRPVPLAASAPEWRVIPSIPEYEASDAGDIRRRFSLRYRNVHHRPLTPQRHVTGYMLVTLVVESCTKVYRVNRLVCEAFHGKPTSEKQQAAHWDGNPLNNRPENLRWATRSENENDKIRHGTSPHGKRPNNTKLTEAQVLELRERWTSFPRYKSNGNVVRGMVKALAKEYGIRPDYLCKIAKGITWGDI